MKTKVLKTFMPLLIVALAATMIALAMTTSGAKADTYSFNASATMTLKSGEEEVAPVKVYDGTDGTRKMKIYELDCGKSYTLTTSENNDYAVLFNMKVLRREDEYGYAYYTQDVDLTFDNVTIKTKNPVQSDVDTGNRYAAVMFNTYANSWGVDAKLNLRLKGENTIELNGVKGDSAQNIWAAMSFINVEYDSTVRNIDGADAKLTLKTSLSSTSGKVSALHAKLRKDRTVAAWYCGDDDCKCYYSDDKLTQKATLGSLMLAKTAHSFVNGKCSACGETNEDKKFIFEFVDYTSESMNGIKYIMIAKAGGKTYAMGKTVNADGSRKAVEVPVKANGVINTATSGIEVFTFQYGSGSVSSTYMADGGYMAVVDGKIVVYEKQYAAVETGLPIRSYQYKNWGTDDYVYEGQIESEDRYSWENDSNIVFDANALCFKPQQGGETGSVLMYRELCGHNGDALMHQPAVAPTCVEQGTKEYWKCSDCNKYYVNGDFEIPYVRDEHSWGPVEKDFTIRAKGHDFDTNGVCKNCAMKRPVYTQVMSTEALKAMPTGTSYIIVIKDGAKTYAMFLPPENPYLIDEDVNNIPDVLEKDIDENGVPNGIKGTDFNENGQEDWIEYKNNFDDGDWERFCMKLAYDYAEQMANRANFVEVTMQADGSITITDEQAMEFYLFKTDNAGVKINDEMGGETPMYRSRSVMTSGTDYYGTPIDLCCDKWWTMFVPNYWIYHRGLLGYYDPDQLSSEPRIYGDYANPGVIDNYHWFIDINADGTACMVTGYYRDMYREGALKLVKYTMDGEKIETIVGINPQANWDSFTIESELPVYIYASVPEYDHVHTMSNWTDNGNGTHSRHCTHEGCPLRETNKHEFGEWTADGESKHRRDCNTCDAFEENEHEFSSNEKVDDNTHSRTCQVCDYVVNEAHQFDDWLPLETTSTQHIRECNCGHSETAEHTFGEAVVVEEATHTTPGSKKYTCTVCEATKTEEIPALPDHEWGKWFPNDRNYDEHYRRCTCGKVEYANHKFGEVEVVTPATHTQEGVQRITCVDCTYPKDSAIPRLPDHEWDDWMPMVGSVDQHVRYCSCQEEQTGKCEWDNGEVTKKATHTETGERKFTCTLCGREKTEEIDMLPDHEWGKWFPNDRNYDEHYRRCTCGKVEYANHKFGEVEVVTPATHTQEGVQRITCVDCTYPKDSAIPRLTDHEWGKWVPSAAAADQHVRYCSCQEAQTGKCEWDSGVVTTEATYETTGVKTYTCTICARTREEALPVLQNTDRIESNDNGRVELVVPEGSEAVITTDTQMEVKDVTDEVSDEAKARVEVLSGDGATVLASYDIELLRNGAAYQPGGKVEVTLPMPENVGEFDDFVVVYIDKDNNVTRCETRVNGDGTITFITDHFSQYAIVGVVSATTTGSGAAVAMIISVCAVVVIGAAAGFIIIKKRKRA